MSRLIRLAAAVLAVALPPASALSAAVKPAPPEIVQRATRYIDSFIQTFANVVAEERYVQECAYPHKRRELVSDFLLVAVPGTPGRYQFRDVIEVDGTAVRNRRERLTSLFVASPSDALQRAREVARESERYNVQDIGTLDQPLLAVGFLQSRYVDRFRYVVGGAEEYRGVRVRYVGFQETARPTIIHRAGDHRDFASRGYFLIDEATGRVLRSEVDLGDGVPPPSIVTSFRFDDDLQMMVPVEMHDPLGTATYGKFRRFTVTTSEKVSDR